MDSTYLLFKFLHVAAAWSSGSRPPNVWMRQSTALQRRLAIADGVLVLLLLSAIWAMVYKPTF